MYETKKLYNRYKYYVFYVDTVTKKYRGMKNGDWK